MRILRYRVIKQLTCLGSFSSVNPYLKAYLLILCSVLFITPHCPPEEHTIRDQWEPGLCWPRRLARITVWAQAKGRGGTRTPLEEFQGFPLSCWASYSRHTVPRACEGNGFALQRLVIAIKNMGWNGKQMCDHHHHHNNYHSHHAQEVLRALLFVIFISQK